LLFQRLRRERSARAPARYPDRLDPAAVRTERASQNTFAGRAGSQDCRARAVAKQNTGRAVLPVKLLGERIRADDQDTLHGPAADKPICRRQRIAEPGAGCAQIKGRRAPGADTILDDAGGGRPDIIPEVVAQRMRSRPPASMPASA